MKLKKRILTFVLIFQLITNIFVASVWVDHNLYGANLRREDQKVNDFNLKSQDILQERHTVEWLDNPTFDIPIYPWYNITEGDSSDINATNYSDQANYEVLGDSGIVKIDNPLSSSDWTVFINPEKPVLPDTYVINSSGAYISHVWDENANQTRNTPSIHWKRNISMPVNMSDYIITSVSLETKFNATVTVSPHIGGIDRDGDSGLDAYAVGDYAKFYVLIADINNNQQYQVAYNQTINLGRDFPQTPSIYDKLMKSVPEDVIISILTSVLQENSFNFTIILGIDIYCEDNEYGADIDRWNSLIIKSLNLTIRYEKKIDQFTSLSWNQIGNKLSGANIDIENATLNFKYKIDKNWTISSPNSEIRVLINDRKHTETIKLSLANSTFQDAKIGGFDVTNLILKNVNITVALQVYIADTFSLDQKITLSIDNATLLISYVENIIEEETKLDLFLNGVNKTLEKIYEVAYGKTVNITVIYKNLTNVFINNAIVQLKGIGNPKNLTENGLLEHYNITIDSTSLVLGNNFLTIEASKKYYETISIVFNIKVVERQTTFQLFLDGQNKTIDKTIEMIYGNNGNITITYKDSEDFPLVHISGANVELVGIGNPKNLTEDIVREQYFIIIDTANLGVGNSFLTVNANKENYSSQSIRFKIEVLERNSYIDEVYLNQIEASNINIAWNEPLNIAIIYRDSLNDNFIESALVQLSGVGIIKNFTENSPFNYSVDINTNLLSLGVNFLTISAQKDNYTLASRIITVTVVERSTSLEIYLNGIHTSLFEFYNISIGESLNISVFYRDFETNNPINSAIVKLIESGVSYNLTEQILHNQYNITIIADDFGVGIKFFTVSAKKDNYSITSELFTLRIIEKKTDFLLFLNGSQYYEGDTIEVEVTDTLNITVRYLDNTTKTFISGATVDLLGIGFLTENTTLQQYQIIINIIDLGEPLNRLIVRGQKQNYQLALIEFFVEVTERDSYGILYLNGINKTADPYIDITVKVPLNITLEYRDGRTDSHISGASIQLSGDLSNNFVEDLIHEQYYLIINTSQLGIGFSIFTIKAERVNFQIFIIQKLYVNINRIRTNISTLTGETNFIIRPGQDALLQIIYYDLDFNDTIKGAIISYRWQFGTGILTDSNNDGVYETTLENVPEGSYTITINAYAGDNYEIVSFNIVLSAIRPQQDILLLLILLIIGSIVIIGLSSYLYAYQKILKYPKPVRKVRKYRKTLNKSKTPTVQILNRDKAFNIIYQDELKNSTKFLKGQPLNGKIKKEELLRKESEEPSKKLGENYK